MNRALITEKKIADLRYSIINDNGVEVLLPIRWRASRLFDTRLIIEAATDQLPISIYGMSVVLDHFRRVTTVEIVDADSVGHYADWLMKSSMRLDLFQAVKVFARRAYYTGVLREWPSGTNPAERMESL